MHQERSNYPKFQTRRRAWNPRTSRQIRSASLDDFTKVVGSWFSQNYFVIHDCICILISSRPKTPPPPAWIPS
jgi:hypothetical protein